MKAKEQRQDAAERVAVEVRLKSEVEVSVEETLI